MYRKRGFPFDTLLRFEMFISIKSQLEKFDYVFFLNANTMCEDFVGDEILPDREVDSGLVCSTHPLIEKVQKENYPYEKNEKSLACIPCGVGDFYTQGAFFGGTTEAFLQMSEILSNNIRTDLDNDIVAIWHDESHLNKYIIGRHPKKLGLEYLCPDTRKYRRRCNPRPKIVLLEKSSYKYGGIDYLRGVSDKPLRIVEYILWRYCRCIYNLFHIKNK